MGCDLMRDSLEDYAQGRLPEPEALVLEAHLRTCPACGRRLLWIRALKASLRGLPRPEMPAPLRAELLRRARARRPAAGLREAWQRAWRPAGLGLAFAAAAGLLVFRHVWPWDTGSLSLDEVLAAHGRYELTMPAAEREAIYADLGLRPSAGGGGDAR